MIQQETRKDFRRLFLLTNETHGVHLRNLRNPLLRGRPAVRFRPRAPISSAKKQTLADFFNSRKSCPPQSSGQISGQLSDLSSYTKLLKDILRFWLRVDIKSDLECWEFNANTQGKYGDFKFDGKAISAHRFAYWLANGQPDEMPEVVRHKCDNPPCCNPHHLIGGTHADNVKDRVQRGRSATGDRNKGGRRKKPCQIAPIKASKPCKISKPAKERGPRKLSGKRRQRLIDMGLLDP